MQCIIMEKHKLTHHDETMKKAHDSQIVRSQSVTCLATDACLTAIPGVASLILARSHTFVGD